MPVQPPIVRRTTGPGAIAERTPHTLYFKRAWSDPWESWIDAAGVAVDGGNLRCNSVALSAPPTISRAQFTFHAGMIAEHASESLRQKDIPDLRGTFIKVALLPAHDPEAMNVDENGGASGRPNGAADPDDGPTETTLFVGYFPDLLIDARGNIAGTDHLADMTYTAYGLEYLLDRADITTAAVDGGEDADAIEHVHASIAFNEDFRFGASPTADDGQKRGNRGPLKTFTNETTEAEISAYVFNATGTGDRWSLLDILRHLIAFHFPQHIKWELVLLGNGMETFLAQVTPPRVNIDGQSPLAILNNLIRRGQGLGWALAITDGEPNEDDEPQPDTIKLEVFSLSEATVPIGSTRLPASSRTRDFTPTNDDPAADYGLVVTDANRFDRIVIEGGPILTCCTFNIQDDPATLEPAWTLADQTAYVQGALIDGAPNPSAEENDTFRGQSRFDHVFRAFRVPDEWDGRMILAEPNGKRNAIPFCEPATGTISADFIAEGETAVNTENPAVPFFRRAGLRFERWIPVRAPISNAGDEREWETLLVFLRNTNQRWSLAHDQTGVGATVRSLDRALGFHLAMQGNTLGGLIMSATYPYGYPADLTYGTLRVTGAFYLHDRIRVEMRTRPPPAEDEPARAENTLRVEVPAAEAWYIVPGTITGIDAQDNFTIHAGGVVRDDSPTLRAYAAMAKAWYGIERRNLTATLQGLQTGYTIGTMLHYLRQPIMVDGEVAGWRSRAIFTTITEVVFDLERQATTVRTDFAELDFSLAASLIG